MLRGIALTNRPVIKNIQPAFFAESDNFLFHNSLKMNQFKLVADRILSSDVITERDVVLLSELAVSLEDNDKQEAEKMIAQAKKMFQEAEKVKEEEAKKEEEEEEAKKEEANKKLSEAEMEKKNLVMQLAEHKKLIDQAHTQLRRKELSETIKSELVLSENVKTGIVPNDMEEFVSFFMNLSEDKSKKLLELIKKIKTVDFSEIGKAGGQELSPVDQFNGLVAEKMKENQGMNLSEAQKIVASENIELASKL